jgi:hypothetical protein
MPRRSNAAIVRNKIIPRLAELQRDACGLCFETADRYGRLSKRYAMSNVAARLALDLSQLIRDWEGLVAKGGDA